MRIIKYQGGGYSLPSEYVDYRKAWYGYLQSLGNSTTSSDKSASSSFQSDEKGAIGIFTKSMTDDVMQKTLPVDGKGLVEMSVRFNEFIDPYDPSSANFLYSNILQKLQEATYQRKLLDDAVKEARDKDAMNGPAVLDDGTVWVRKKNKILKKPISRLKSYDRVLTVGELAYLRAHNDQLSFDLNSINTVDNATSIKVIQEQINRVLSVIGEEETKQSAYLTKEQVENIQGLQGIRSAAIDGTYKLTINVKDNRKQAMDLIDAVYQTLTNTQIHYLTVLTKRFNITAKDKQTKENIDPVRALLMQLIRGRFKTVQNYEVNFEKDMTASSLGYDIYGGKEKSDSKGDKAMSDIKSSPVIEFFLQRSEKEPVTMQIGRGLLQAVGTRGILEDSSGNPLGGFVDLTTVSSSGYAKGMNTNQMYFGSTRVDNKHKNKVIVDGSSLINVALPIDPNSREIKPDFTRFDKITRAYNEVQNTGTKDIKQINRIFQKYGLPNIYTVGQNGQIILTGQYRQFAVMHGYADSKALKSLNGDDLDQIVTLQKPNRDELDDIVELIKGSSELNKGYKPTWDYPWLLGFRKQDIYEGSVFIPIYQNPLMYLDTDRTLGQSEKVVEAFNDLGKQKKQHRNTPKVNGLTR